MIIERVGMGGMGVVFQAKQLSMDRIVALKVLNERYSNNAEFVDRFIREARAAGKIEPSKRDSRSRYFARERAALFFDGIHRRSVGARVVEKRKGGSRSTKHSTSSYSRRKRWNSRTRIGSFIATSSPTISC